MHVYLKYTCIPSSLSHPQGILNKLTPQKFKNLAENARELEINTEERLKGCIDKIFSKVQLLHVHVHRYIDIQITCNLTNFLI